MLTAQNRAINRPGLALTARMDPRLACCSLRLSRIAADSSRSRSRSRSPGHSSLANAGRLARLDCKGFPHDGTSLAKQLELGESPTARRGLRTGRGRQSTQGSRSGGLEKRAHGLGLTKDGVHGQGASKRKSTAMICLWFERRRSSLAWSQLESLTGQHSRTRNRTKESLQVIGRCRNF